MKFPEPEDSFTEMIARYEKVIYKVCSVYAGERSPLEDLYQEAVCNLWRAYPRFWGESSPSTWIYRIALNTCLSDLRKRLHRPRTVPLEQARALAAPESADDGRAPELREQLRRLNGLDRAIVLLYLEGRPYKEIASVIGLSVANIAVRLNRIRKKLSDMSNR